MKRAFMVVVVGTIFTLCIAGSLCLAADYPTKPITLIVPVSPGGSHDIIGRMFGTVAEKYLGQPIVFINRPGASTMLGTLESIKAAPDGYTLAEPSEATTAVIEWEIANGRKPPFTRHEFIPIGSWTQSPTLVVVPYNSPWKNLGDLVTDCKAKPDKYAFCSGGLYAATHLPVILFMRANGITARHVPYQGGGPCLGSLVGGHVDFAMQFPSTCIPLARGKKLRIFAVSSEKRLRSLPDVPTCKELGVDVVFHMWLGLAVPLKTPQPIVDKLRDVFKKVMEDKAFIKLVEDAGSEVEPLFGDDLAKYWDKDSEMHAKIFQQIVKETK
jgi:tripartite-type tricarboxylate transporter receptor subunit TctC